ncbi:MAG: DUF3147 family protein [Bacteroidales bacterium]|nr:DUF3147 family protein [Bacteroidales bacterium]MBN2748650.1 DUF3147 family protein [Bacteroidales bacterium]
MESSSFLIKVGLSIVIAGLWISTATILAQKLGSKLGGLIANLPSTILVSVLFIALTQGAVFAADSTKFVPIGMTIDTIFLLVFIATAKHGVAKATILSLLSWLILAVLASYMPPLSAALGILLFAVTVIGAFTATEYFMNIPSLPRERVKPTMQVVLTRAIFSGSVVGAAVVVGQSGSAFWTGVTSTFPAVMLSSMVILTVTAGKAFARATGKVMLVSSTNIVVYGFAVSWLYPKVGIVWGTIVSFGLSALWVYMLRPLVNKIR